MIGGFVGGVAASAVKDVRVRWPRGGSANVNPNPPPAGPPPAVKTKPDRLLGLHSSMGDRKGPPVGSVRSGGINPPPPPASERERPAPTKTYPSVSDMDRMREAVHVLAQNLSEYTMSMGTHGYPINSCSDEVLENPIALAAVINAARKTPGGSPVPR